MNNHICFPDCQIEITRLTDQAAIDKDFILQYQSQVSHLESVITELERVEGENRKLRYVMETAQTMRDDYESYSFSDAYAEYVTEVHDPEILKDFDDAIKAVNDA